MSTSDLWAANLAALELLATLRQTDRQPADLSSAERATLARYSGWGNNALLDSVFTRPLGAREYACAPAFAAVLTPLEQAAIRESAPTAFYTPPAISAVCWQALARMGLADLPTLRVLEPAAGTGAMLATMPPALRAKATITAVEREPLAAAICRYTHPDVTVYPSAWQDVPLAAGSMDLIVTNVPFHNVPVRDQTLPKALRGTVHDYFLARAITTVRPGGVVCALTSYGTLDKRTNTVRGYLAHHADLVAAIRLPMGTFALTDAGADLLILQRRAQPNATASPWVQSLPQPMPDNTTQLEYNVVFGTNPHWVVGDLTTHYGHYGARVVSTFADPAAIPAAVAAVLDTVDLPTVPPVPVVAPAALQLAPAALHTRAATLNTPKAQDRGAGMARIYDCAKALFAADRDADTAVAHQARAELNRVYDAFVAAHGVIHDNANDVIIRHQPEYHLLGALEVASAVGWIKATVFHEPVVAPHVRTRTDHAPDDALAICLDTTGGVDMALLQHLTSLDQPEIIAALKDQIIEALELGSTTWVLTEVLCSGNVGDTLDHARQLARLDPRFTRHVTLLEQAIPEPILPSDVWAPLGAPWVPADMVETFANAHVPSRYDGGKPYTVRCFPSTGVWEVTPAWPSSDDAFGTALVPPHTVLEKTLNGTPIEVSTTVTDSITGQTKRVKDPAESLAAHAKQDKWRAAWTAWIAADTMRLETLAAIWNRRFNQRAVRRYDGSHLTFPGLVTTALRQGDLDPHQKDVIWQILQNPTTMIVHPVGAGKSLAVIAAAIKATQLGKCRRPAIMVPNKLADQWADEIQRFFPGTRTIVVRNTTAIDRQTLLSQVATQHWDLVLITAPCFTTIPVGAALTESFYTKMIAETMAVLAELEVRDARSRTIKQTERTLQAQRAKLETRLWAIKHDSAAGITWEDLGIDMLFVDEVHNYRSLGVQSNRTSIAGVPSNHSACALDLRMKTWDLLQRNHEVVFATATPVMNTLAEVYIMMTYLQEPLLAQHGLATFDAWSRTFADVVTNLEITPDASGYRLFQRMATFLNVPELLAMLHECWNVVSPDELGLPQPAIKGGKPRFVVTAASDRQRAIVATLAQRADAIRSGTVSRDTDNMLVITKDGRLAALCPSLVDNGPPDQSSKIVDLCDEIITIYHTPPVPRATQLVFCDLSVPQRSDNDNDSPPAVLDDGPRQITVYAQIRHALMARGIPGHEIAFSQDHKTAKQRNTLFAKVNAGTVRVLIASTAMLSEGVNIQKRMCAVHHLNPPWHPEALRQRNGRAGRPGNLCAAIDIIYYTTAATFDVYCWQLIETKAQLIDQLHSASRRDRRIGDVGSMDLVVLTAAEIKALATGNPLLAERITCNIQRQQLELLYDVWLRARLQAAKRLRTLPAQIAHARTSLAAYQTALAVRNTVPEPWSMTIHAAGGDVTATTTADAVALLLPVIAAAPDHTTPLARLGGFVITATYQRNRVVVRLADTATVIAFVDVSMQLRRSLTSGLARLEGAIDNEQAEIKHLCAVQRGSQITLGREWEHHAAYLACLADLARLDEALAPLLDDASVVPQVTPLSIIVPTAAERQCAALAADPAAPPPALQVGSAPPPQPQRRPAPDQDVQQLPLF